MASLNTAVDQAANILKDRISELEGELGKLQRALASLTDGRQGRRGPGRPRGSSSRPRARRARAGAVAAAPAADQAVKLIEANPGISASEIAKQMKIKPNYLYRVLGDLQKEGKVKKSGRSYTAADNSTVPVWALDETQAVDGVALLAELGDRRVDALLDGVVDPRPWTIAYSPPEHVHG